MALFQIRFCHFHTIKSLYPGLNCTEIFCLAITKSKFEDYNYYNSYGHVPAHLLTFASPCPCQLAVVGVVKADQPDHVRTADVIRNLIGQFHFESPLT
jgi:hypothetical protein